MLNRVTILWQDYSQDSLELKEELEVSVLISIDKMLS